MGTTPADTEREITHLRGDMTAALDEVERRLRGGLRGVAGAEARITSTRARDDITHRARIRRRVKDVREEFRGRVEEGVEASRRRLERAKPSSLLVKLEPADAGLMRLTEAHLEGPVNKSKGRQDVIKKLVWAGLLSVFMAVGSVLARRVAGGVWHATVHEEPPTQKSSK